MSKKRANNIEPLPVAVKTFGILDASDIELINIWSERVTSVLNNLEKSRSCAPSPHANAQSKDGNNA